MLFRGANRLAGSSHWQIRRFSGPRRGRSLAMALGRKNVGNTRAVRGAPSPSWLRIAWLTLVTCSRGRREPRHIPPEHAHEALSAPLPWQRVVKNQLYGWLEELGIWTRNLLESIRAARANTERTREDNAEKLIEAEAKRAQVDPRFETSPWLMVVVVLAAILGGVAAWRFVEAQVSGFVPITAVASGAFAVIEIVLAGLLGRCIGAIVLDKPATPNELTPSQRALNRIGSVILLGALGIIAFLFADARGNLLLWLAVMVSVNSAGLYLGLAIYDQRHHRKADKHKKIDLKLASAIDLLDAFETKVTRAAWGKGHQLCGLARTILDRAAIAFRRFWRRWHRGTPVPPLPAVHIPDDDELLGILFAKLEGEASSGAAGADDDGPDGPTDGGPDRPPAPPSPTSGEDPVPPKVTVDWSGGFAGSNSESSSTATVR
jgi:hypothetical protein